MYTKQNMKIMELLSSIKRAGSHLILLFLLIAFISGPLQAQREPGDVGIGIQIGQPTGLAIKVYNPGTSVDILAAWNWDDLLFLNMHAIFDAALNDNHTVHFFYGPGAYVGLRERPGDDIVDYGISGNFGIDFLISKFEIYLQATPRLSLLSTRDFDMGGGVGFRFYF